jgi:Domain of unknown function (DUF4262)
MWKVNPVGRSWASPLTLGKICLDLPTRSGYIPTSTILELLVFGLPIPTAHQLLNELGHRIKAGEVLNAEIVYTDIIQTYPVVFKSIKAEFIEDYFGIAVRFYGHADFTALQMCWTDKASRFPWEPDFDPRMKQAQPLLF